MPIESPKLDDLIYGEVFDDLVRRIPVHTPEWTDFNDSDPGITLLQLFAHLAEQIGYRLNRVPEKNHIELLKLLGVRLKPAHAATTRMAILLNDSFSKGNESGITLPAGTRSTAKQGTPPPVFETDMDIDLVPAEPVVLLTTHSELLYQLRLNPNDTTSTDTISAPADPKNNEWLRVIWDGKKPAYAALPTDPLSLSRDDPDDKEGHNFLWIGLKFNPELAAGFRGVRVTLTLQFDDDEQPTQTAIGNCQCSDETLERVAAPVDWLAYFNADASDPAKAINLIPGRIDDSTQRFTSSGTLRFTVPFGIGPIPTKLFANLQDSTVPTALDALTAVSGTLSTKLLAIPSPVFQDVVTGIVNDLKSKSSARPLIPHPLDAKFQDPDAVQGWLRIKLSPDRDRRQIPKLRMLTFNAVSATHNQSANNELLGNADGRPGQEYRLLHGNVIADSLELVIAEAPSNLNQPLVVWNEVDSLDRATPTDRVYELDREAGLVRFGDGKRGRIPTLIPRGGTIVALRYLHGGNATGNIPVASLEKLNSGPSIVNGVVNYVKGSGGRDAEQLDDAKIRARKELSIRSRAVTSDDFSWIALQTPGVRVARAIPVPLRRPLLPTQSNPVPVANCGPALSSKSAGLANFVAAGAVSVVVVPDEQGPEPAPTPSFLNAVCRQLDRHRLVTTEVYVVPPQFVRFCEFFLVVRAHPGFTRVQVQDEVEHRLARWLHVLTGGDDGNGFPFGGQVHIADMIAQIVRTPSVERVEVLSCRFTRTKSDARPRQGRLVLCPNQADETDRLELALEETVSFDPSKFVLNLSARQGNASIDPLCPSPK